MQLRRSLAVVCASCCLLAAYSHLSLIGLAFLACYLAWCCTCIATPQLAASYRHHRALWVTVTVLSGTALVAQLVVQPLYAMHLLPSAGSSSSSEWLPPLLEALGLSDLRGAPAGEVLQVLLAPLVLLAAAAAEAAEAGAALRTLANLEASTPAATVVPLGAGASTAAAPAPPQAQTQAAPGGTGLFALSSTAGSEPVAILGAIGGPATRDIRSKRQSPAAEQQQQQQQQQEGMAGSSAASGAMYSSDATDGASLLLPLSSGLKYSNEGIFLGLLLVPSICLSPTLVNVPYLLVLCWVVLRWSRGDTIWATPAQLLPMQAYCVLQLVALYLHQLLALLGVLPAAAEHWTQLVGLYGWVDLSGVDPGQPVPSALQLAHFVVLHVLCAVMGLNLSLVRQPLYQGLHKAHLQQQAQQHSQQQQQAYRRQPGPHSQRQQQAQLNADARLSSAGAQQRRSQLTQDLDALQEPLMSRTTSQASDHSVIEIPPHPRVPGDIAGNSGTPKTAMPVGSVPEDAPWMPIQQQQQQQLGSSPGPPGSSPRISLLRLSSMRDWHPLQQYLREAEDLAPAAHPGGAAGVSMAAPGVPGLPVEPPTTGLAAQLRLLSYVLLPMLASFGELAVLGLTSAPATAAIAMAGFAMVQVSLLGGITLIAALSSLLMPGQSGKAALQRCTPFLVLLYICWLVLSYVATALVGIVSPPAVVKSLGLWGYTAAPPAVLPFLLQLLTAVVVSGLARNQAAAARSTTWAPAGVDSLGPVRPPAAASRAGRSSTQPPMGSSPVPAAPALADMLSSIALEEQQVLQALRDNVQTWSRSLGVGSVQLIWHLGQLVVPLSWGFLAATRPDILHGIYLLAMVAVLLTYNLWHTVPQLPRLPLWALHALQQHQQVEGVADAAPQQQEVAIEAAAAAAGPSRSLPANGATMAGRVEQARGDQQQYLPTALPAARNARYGVLRGYATAHLLVIYSALVLQLPGLKSDFNQRVLQLVGLLDPRIVTDLVPVLLVLLGATVEVALGKWLATHVVDGVQGPLAAGGSTPGMAAPARDSSSSAAATQRRGPAGGALRQAGSSGSAAQTRTASAGQGQPSTGPAIPPWLLQQVHYPQLVEALVDRAVDNMQRIDSTTIAGCPPQDNPSAVLWWLQAVHQPLLFQALVTAGRGALAAGVPALVLLGYLLLLVDTPPGLLGLAYLAMLLGVYLVPPSATGYLAYIQHRVQQACKQQPSAAPAAIRARRGMQRQQGQGATGLEELQPLLASHDPRQQPSSSSHSAINGGSAATEQQGQSLQAHALSRGVAEAQGRHQGTSVWLQWVAWLLMACMSLLCAADLLTQYVLVVGAVVQEAPLLPPDWSDWVRDVVGIDDDASGRQLLLALLRPTLLLASQCVIKYCCAIGGAAAWHARATTRPAAAAALALQKQQGWRWLAKRCAIIHTGNFLAAAAFAAAMQLPSATGLALVSLVVGTTWLTRGRPPRTQPGLGSGTRRRAAPASNQQTTSLAAYWAVWLLQLLGAAWVLLLYVLQLSFLRGPILSRNPGYLPGLLAWLGLPLLSLEPDPAGPFPGAPQPGMAWPYLEPSTGYTLSKLLQWKVVMLVAAALWKQSRGWLHQMPAGLLAYHKGVGGSGPCPLFWPPSHLGRQPWTISLRSSIALLAQQSGRRLSLLVTLCVKLLQVVSATSARALRAMDINPGDIHLGVVGEDPLDPLLAWLGVSGAGQVASSSQDGAMVTPGLLSGYLLQVVQRVAEPLWTIWGLDASLLLLLLAAFYSCTMLSLVYVLLVGMGMWLQPSASQRLWRVAVVPFLGAVLAWQYATYLGLPPLPASSSTAGEDGSGNSNLHGSEPPAAPADVLLQHWLGASYVQPATLWLLLAALWAAWVQSRQPGQAAAVPGTDPEAVWAATMHTEVQQTGMQPPAAAAAPKPPTREQAGPTRVQQQDAAVQTCPTGYTSTWCQGPRRSWTAAEVVCYHLARHCMDLLLVCVVVVCAVQRDITHAGYLALALIGFRHRQPQPAASGPVQNSAAPAGVGRGPDQASANLLAWLQTFNVCVMAAMLLYQSPLELLMGPSWAVSCQLQTASHCTAPHLLGFCKLLQWEPANTTANNSAAWQAPWPLQQPALWQDTILPGNASAMWMVQRPSAAPGDKPEAASSSNSYWSDGFLAVSLLAISGSMADIVLWVLLRLQLKLQQSQLYGHILEVAAQEAQGSAAALQLKRQGWYLSQAAAALTTSRLKLARLLRINQLKEIMLEKGVTQAEGSQGQMVGEASWADVAAAAEAVSGLSPQPSMEYAEGLLAAQGAAEPVVVSEHPLAHAAEQQEQGDGNPHVSSVTGGEQAGVSGSQARVGHQRRPTYDGAGIHPQRAGLQQQGQGQPRAVPPSRLPHFAASGGTTSSGSYHARSASDPTGGWGSWSDNGNAAQQQPAPAELQLTDPRLTMLRHQQPSAATYGALTGSSPDLLGLQGPAEVEPPSSSILTGSHSRLQQLQAAAAGPGSVTSEPAGDSSPQPGWLAFLSSRTSRAAVCYALYILAFLYDYSVLTLVYPVSMLVWALLSQRRAFRYWKVMLVYTEVLLVAQYSFLTASKCLCIGSQGGSSGGSPPGQSTTGDPTPSGSSSSSGGSAGCMWLVGDAALKHHLDLLGLHAAAGKDILLFLVYLATLTYHHHLSSYQPLSVEVLANRLALEAPGRSGSSSSSTAAAPAARWRMAAAGSGSWTVLLQGWVAQLWQWLVRVLWALADHLRCIAWPHEQYPSWILLELGPPPGGVGAWTSPQGAQLLQGGCQQALDALRSSDVAAAAAAPKAAGVTPAAMSALAGLLGIGDATVEAGQEGQLHEAEVSAQDMGGGGDAGMQRSWSVESLAGLQQPSGLGGSAYDSQAADATTGIDLSRYTRLLLRLDRVMLRQPAAAAQLPAAAAAAALGPAGAPPAASAGAAGMGTACSSTAGGGMGGSAQQTPRFIETERTLPPGGPSSAFSAVPAAGLTGLQSGPGLVPCAVALFEVVPEPQASTRPTDGGALGPLLMSSSRPGRDAAAALLRLQEQQRSAGLTAAAAERLQQQAPPSTSMAGGGTHVSSTAATAACAAADAATWLPCSLLGVEHHSAAPRDYYTATAAIDVAAFIYAALFYQVVFSSARTLADITDEKQLPWDYLAVLICLFLCMVAARVFYSLGSQLGHFLLYCIQLAAFLTCTMSLYWSRPMEPAAHNHLRVFLGLKLVSFCLAAQQLRCGFPPRASFNGGGRQQFLFFAHADTWYMMGFYAFQAVPFLYELRVLLDWTAAATSLSWYQWLKLEDIRASLFLDEVRAAGRASRALGERVPRWQKFLQGTLLFSLLLVAIWLPLLLFSSGAPTYQVPQLVDVRVAASIGVVTQYSSYAGVMNFPLFEVGMRHTTQNWHLLPAPPAPPANSSNGNAASNLRGPRPALPAHRQGATAGRSSTHGSNSTRALAAVPRGGQTPAVQQRDWHQVPGHPMLHQQRQLLGSRLQSRKQQQLHGQPSKKAVGEGAGGEEGPLPYSLQGYTPDQVKLVCLSPDSDVMWSITPPAKAALSAVLQEPAAALTLSWSLLRTAPLASSRGGPLCSTDLTLPLAGESRRQLLEVLEGNRSSAQLRVLDPTDPRGWAPGHNGTAGLYGLFWRLRGDACAVRTRFEPRPDSQGAASSAEDAWLGQEVGCSVSLVQGEAQPEGAQWWQFSCDLVSSETPEVTHQNGPPSPTAAAAAARTAEPAGGKIRMEGASPAAATPPGVSLQAGATPTATTTAASSTSSSSKHLQGPARRAARLRRLQCSSAAAASAAAAPVSQVAVSLPGQSEECGGHQTGASCRPVLATSSTTQGPVEASIQASSSRGSPSSSAAVAAASSSSYSSSEAPDVPVLAPAVGCEEGFLGPPLVVVLERVQSGLLGAALSSIGITGLYISFVFGIGRFLRLTVSNIRLRIPYEDFPSTAALVALVQDIYIARAEGELALEEELFYLLLKIYKTPDLLQQLTRGKDRDRKEKQE